MASDFNNIITPLSAIGNRVGDSNTNGSNYNKVNWSVDRFKDIIGWLGWQNSVGSSSMFIGSYGNVFTVQASPYYSATSLVNEQKLKMSLTYGREKDTITLTSERNKTNLTAKLASGLGTNAFQVEYKKKKYTGYILNGFPQTIEADDGAIIHVNSLESVYAVTEYKEDFPFDAKDKTSGIPFYCWYSITSDKGNKLFVGVKLNLKSKSGDTYPMTGWVEVYSDIGTQRYLTIRPKEKLGDKSANPVTPKDVGIVEAEIEDVEPGVEQSVDWSATTEWENSQDYVESLIAAESDSQFNYWKQLYEGDMGGYSLQSHRSIIGLPLQFMSNVDMRIGSAKYGKQYMEDILYDMNIACIKPGGPVLNPSLSEDVEYSEDIFTKGAKTLGKAMAYYDSLKTYGAGKTLQQYIFSLFKGNSARFYSFQSDYTHYTHYVNTLCHLFITYLNIGDKYYTTSTGTQKKYTYYNDEPAEIETDGGSGLGHQFGFDNAVYMYYSPESSISHTFANSTTQSALNDTLASASSAAKEWGFFINAAGLEGGGIGKSVSSFSQSLAANNGSGLLGRLFGNLAEGTTTVLAGNNLSLPEIYSDSETTVQHQFKIKLASPYGDPESVFLYVLRPLARLLAFSLPRQYGPNSYMSPFIVQAFSKGQFNCQLGIVTELSVSRCGNGGESHTINHIPTELEVTLTIQDMYEKVFLSNEYFGNSAWKVLGGAAIDLLTGGFDKVGQGIGTALAQTGMTLTATRLLFNNVGLIDFVASFCGANLNQQTHMTGWTVIWNMMKNRSAEIVSYNENDGWKFNQWEKQLNDSFNDASAKLYSAMTTIA